LVVKTLLVVAAAAGLVGSAALAPAFAEGPRASGGNNWPGMNEPVAGNPAPDTAASGSHWQWEITYAHGGKPRGEWVLVP
jgi:hypothetical protein